MSNDHPVGNSTLIVLPRRSGAHACQYAWCRNDTSDAAEHWGDGLISIRRPSNELEEISCYASVTDDGEVYVDEIALGVAGSGVTLNATLTVDEAMRLRDLIDTAIAHRAEARKTQA
jgi:hypothetical protein